MKTSRGIYLDLSESDYIFKYEGLEFYFSSIKYLEKFKTNVEKYITEETIKLELKYKISIDFRKYLSLSYYRKIEKRGFRVKFYSIELNKNFVISNLVLR